MIGTNGVLFLSALLVAVPTVRAAYRILLARWKSNAADRKTAAVEKLQGQERQTQLVVIERLKNEAHDLIEFSTLVPTWALLLGMGGIILNILARAHPILFP